MSEKKNILVIGSSGQLGCCLRKISSSRDDIAYVSRSPLKNEDELILCRSGADMSYIESDALDKDSVVSLIRSLGCSVIVNCAAYTNVDGAEDEREECMKGNVMIPKVLSEAANETDCLLVHISSDYVYGDGYRSPIAEDDECNPINQYGLSKLNGDKTIQESGCRYVILRTSWVISEFGKNFYKSIVKKLYDSSSDRITVVDDQVGSPTSGYDLARAVLHIIDVYLSDPESFDRYGIYNFSNEGVCSWYDLAYMIGFKNHIERKIVPCRTHAQKAVRPHYSVMDKTKFKTTFEDMVIPHWFDIFVCNWAINYNC